MGGHTEHTDGVNGSRTRDRTGAGGPAGTVERVAEVLLAFADTPGDLGVTELAQRIGVSKASVHRVLNVLRDSGLIVLDDVTHRYSLGPTVLRLGSSYRSQVIDRAVDGRLLRRLVEETGETAVMWVLSGRDRIVVDEAAPDREVRFEIDPGTAARLHAGAAGKALLAALDGEVVELVLSSSLERVAPGTIVEPDRLRREFEVIRRDGFASGDSECVAGVASVATTVARPGRPLAAIELCGPSERFIGEFDRLGSLLVNACADMRTLVG